MITFLNFAPLSFMGGAEKWMKDMAEYVSTREDVRLVDVSHSISGVYGRLVLKRSFADNTTQHKEYPNDAILSLEPRHFIPFSRNWRIVKDVFAQSRLIYLRFELPELLICLYFGGPQILKKCVAGLHMSILYEDPKGFFQQAHNVIYGSRIFGMILAHSRRVHVINRRDQKLLTEKFRLSNLAYLPNGTEIRNQSFRASDRTKLKLIFVGELSERKGVDSVIDTIRIAPEYCEFHIVGEGPLKKAIADLSKQKPNCVCHGYVTTDQLQELYRDADALFFPSRAEAFGLVMIEAMANGLLIINSNEIELGLPKHIEYTAKNRKPETFLDIFSQIFERKRQNKIDRPSIVKYCDLHFAHDSINEQFFTKILA